MYGKQSASQYTGVALHNLVSGKTELYARVKRPIYSYLPPYPAFFSPRLLPLHSPSICGPVSFFHTQDPFLTF
ncbi:hypothetical protein J6590_053636 [Homalodisca vitripennis]|nr:hypothetical protein J6590_053636 [Homalodisca vitripennis]